MAKPFSKQFNHLFRRVGRIRNYKMQAEFFKNLIPIHQKGRRMPIALQDKVDKEIEKLLEQGHIQSWKSVQIIFLPTFLLIR